MSERIAVVGSSGSGKSTLARAIASQRGHALLELDAVHQGPGWVRRPDAETRPEVEAFLAEQSRWVIDGNYRHLRDLIWPAADTIVWLDLPRAMVMYSLLRRTLRRVITREELWNGNRENWRDALSLDPERSVLAWSFTRFNDYRDEYARARREPSWCHLRWERLGTRHEVRDFLER